MKSGRHPGDIRETSGRQPALWDLDMGIAPKGIWAGLDRASLGWAGPGWVEPGWGGLSSPEPDPFQFCR